MAFDIFKPKEEPPVDRVREGEVILPDGDKPKRRGRPKGSHNSRRSVPKSIQWDRIFARISKTVDSLKLPGVEPGTWEMSPDEVDDIQALWLELSSDPNNQAVTKPLTMFLFYFAVIMIFAPRIISTFKGVMELVGRRNSSDPRKSPGSSPGNADNDSKVRGDSKSLPAEPAKPWLRERPGSRPAQTDGEGNDGPGQVSGPPALNALDLTGRATADDSFRSENLHF